MITATEAPSSAPELDNSIEDIELVPATQPIELSLRTGTTNSRFKLTDNGVDIDPNISFEEWQHGLGVFRWMQSKMKVGFADYVTFGRVKFGRERTEQSLAQLEFDFPTVRTALEIGTVPPELRLPGLDAEHLSVLARSELSFKEQQLWAQRASTQHLSPNVLKQSIAAGEVVSSTVAKQRQTGVITLKGIRQEFDTWLRRVDGAEGIRKMSLEVQADLLEDLSVFHELYVTLTILRRPAAKAKKTAKRKAAKRKAAKK